MYTYLAVSLLLFANLTTPAAHSPSPEQAADTKVFASHQPVVQQKGAFAAAAAAHSLPAVTAAPAQALEAFECTSQHSKLFDIPGIGKRELPTCSCPEPKLIYCKEKCMLAIYCTNTIVEIPKQPCTAQLERVKRINEILAAHKARAFCCVSLDQNMNSVSHNKVRTVTYPNHPDNNWRRVEFLNYSLQFKEADAIHKELTSGKMCPAHIPQRNF